MAVISADLLSGFEPNLLSHTLSLFGSQELQVNAYSLATKCGFFLRGYTELGSAHKPLIVTLDDVGSVDNMKIVLYFCHFDCLPDMQISLLKAALTAAVHFDCKELEQYATEFACSQLSVETANSIWQQVRGLPNLRVAETIREFVLRHFLALAQREDFREFSAETLVDLMKDDRLNTWQEDLLVEPLLGWLRGRPTPLWDLMCLLSSLRYDLLSERARTALAELNGFQYFTGFRRSPMFSTMCQQPVESRRPHEAVLVLGGRDMDAPTRDVFLLEPGRGPKAHRWPCPSWLLAPRLCLPEPRVDFGCAVLGDHRIIVAGGQKGPEPMRHTAECLCLDLRNREATWRQTATLHEARSGLATIVCDSVLYAVGGESLTGCFSTVESLDAIPKSDPGGGPPRWRLRAPLPPPARSRPGLACVAGRVIACGGFCSTHGTNPREFVDAYDPRADQWTRLAPMRHPRGGASALALSGTGEHPQLLVLGGNAGAVAERLQFFPAGYRQPRWVAPAPAPATQMGATIGCVVDSRWLVIDTEVEPGDAITTSIAVPTHQLAQSDSCQQTEVPPSPNWFRSLSVSNFALVTVVGLPMIERLMEGAVFV